MKKTIFIAVIMAILTSGFFFYNSQSIADDKNAKCCSGECTKSENCKEDCKSKCDMKNGQSSSGDIKECPYKSGKMEMKEGECPYKSGKVNQNEGTKKSGTCPYMKKEVETKI